MKQKKKKSLVLATVLTVIFGPFAFGYVRSGLGLFLICLSWAIGAFAFINQLGGSPYATLARLASLFYIASIIVSVWSVHQENLRLEIMKKPF